MNWRVWLMDGKTHCVFKWIVSIHLRLGCFLVGFPSAKSLEHILDSSDSTKFTPSLLASVWHHLGLTMSFGNLCHFYLQFVWVASIIIAYSSTTSVLPRHICLFLSEFVFQQWLCSSFYVLFHNITNLSLSNLLDIMLWYENSKFHLPIEKNGGWNTGIVYSVLTKSKTLLMLLSCYIDITLFTTFSNNIDRLSHNHISKSRNNIYILYKQLFGPGTTRLLTRLDEKKIMLFAI